MYQRPKNEQLRLLCVHFNRNGFTATVRRTDFEKRSGKGRPMGGIDYLHVTSRGRRLLGLFRVPGGITYGPAQTGARYVILAPQSYILCARLSSAEAKVKKIRHEFRNTRNPIIGTGAHAELAPRVISRKDEQFVEELLRGVVKGGNV